MNYGNLIIIALRALSNNKLRGFLTMLGIIIGVSSVISMLAIGEGSKRSIEKQIEELGANMIVVNPTNAMVGGIRQNGVIVQTFRVERLSSHHVGSSLLGKLLPLRDQIGTGYLWT